MSKKTELVATLLKKIEPSSPKPEPLAEATLVEQGLYAILLRRLEPKAAERVVEALRKAFVDWNEMRVSQAQEISQHFRVGNRAKSTAVAEDIRSYLQEVFQRSHGLDLEFLRSDAEATKRFSSILPFIGMGTAHYLLWLADDKQLPITAALARVLDRIGVSTRMTNVKKARTALGPIVPKGRELEFAIAIGEVASRWCHAQSPVCHQCPVVDDCKYGKKAYREWKVAQERAEAQRQREEARMAVLRKKEEARRAREEARQAKKEAAEKRAREREEARKAKVAAAKKAAEEKKLAAQRAREEAKRKREEERARKKAAAEAKKKAAAEKRAREAAAKKKAEEKKKLAAKKKAEAAKKAAAKKKAALKKKAEAKKKAAKKAAKKKVRKAPTRRARKA